MVVGQIGQSLDGRTATMTGHSHYINGSDGLDHLHRLRAIVDAVVIGVGTAVADDPLLTVRRVARPASRARHHRSQPPAAGLRARAARRRRRAPDHHPGGRLSAPPGIESIALPIENGGVSPRAILASLAARGLRRILIEGGSGTISRFLEAHCLDRLHVVVAPIILGGGLSGLALTPIARCEEALRPHTRTHLIGSEVLFDCDLSPSARADRRGEKVEVTDPHRGAPRRDMGAAFGEPCVEQARRDAHFACGTGPAGQHFALDRLVGRSEHPVGGSLRDRKAFRLVVPQWPPRRRAGRAPDQSPCR